ncbi:5'-deoxyadenosine deaminase [Streptomyces microflavus]
MQLTNRTAVTRTAVTTRTAGGPVTATYWMDHAWLGTHVEPDVTVEGPPPAHGRIAQVRTGVETPPPGATVLRGLTLPGLANTHSHAFHRALRATVQVGSGTFWTWRAALMYRAASRLTPDSYFDLARATYAEMALAGITSVGEFHYLHHAPGGTPYDNPNAMGEALIAAAAEAGIRITLLDTAYLAAGFGEKPNRHQLRFSDTTADAWAERASLLKGDDHTLIGAAIHSVRAVPADQLATVAAWAEERSAPLHVHLRTDGGERRLQGRPRPHPDPAAGRPRGPRPAHHRHSQHAFDGGGHRPARRLHHRHLHAPHHRTRPRRRHRPRRRPPEGGLAALAGQRQPRRHRPLRRGAGDGAQRAAAHPHPATGRPPPC